MSKKLITAAVCALSLGALAPVADAHTLTKGRAAAEARAVANDFVAQDGTDAYGYTLNGCYRVTRHVVDCAVTFDMTDQYDDEDDSDIADENGDYTCDAELRVRFPRHFSRRVTSSVRDETCY